MLDFLMVSSRNTRQGIDIYPRFKICHSSDLMVRGGDFYAVWDEERGLWSTDEQDAIRLVDREIDIFAGKHKELGENVHVLHLWDAETGQIDKWHRYVQSQMRDSFHPLDEKIIFSDMEVCKTDYASRRLPYPLKPCETPAFDKITSVLYSEEELTKIEWAIGAIVSGDSKHIQKFMVLHGAMGTGKSTIINIIQMMFDGYWKSFDAKTLGSASNAFALEAFRSNPLVAIEHDGDLSRIEDNTRINSLVSHEFMTVNEKFKSAYSNRFNSFLIMGTNKPVRITDARSGIIRRLIDVEPTGNTLPQKEYDICMEQIKYELGGIAYHCLEVYREFPERYANYIPVRMLSATNDFYNFVQDSSLIFAKEDGVTLKAAWEMYKTYCDDAKVAYPLSRMKFKEELRNYFRDFLDRWQTPDGTRVRSWYAGFRAEKFESSDEPGQEPEAWLIFSHTTSLLDRMLADCPAQYAKNDIPAAAWDSVTTRLSELDTGRLHYVRVPENHIVIDFDICDGGGKSFEKNIAAAVKFPPTYAELSKSGQGIHLHYIYDGDVTRLARTCGENIEIKVFTGKSSLRRKLSRCNDIPVKHITSGLPTREVKNMVDFKGIENEKMLRSLISKNLNKEIVPNTKPSVDLIFKDLETAYASGIPYDISDMRGRIAAFAAGSSNQADYCLKQVGKMKFKSAEESEPVESEYDKIIFFDVEVFPNLFLVNWKFQNSETVSRMINPKPADIEELIKYRLIGFNCRRYDNHLLYACLMGYTVEQLYSLSQRIITKGEGFFGEAYNLSYTDVYDFSAKKQSLKKFEIELGIHHQELGLPWDKPVPEELWTKVAEYCDNDVIATEAVFNARHADFVARQVLADVAGGTVNDTTNSLTTRIIFGKERHPQSSFNYRFMGEGIFEPDARVRYHGDLYSVFDENGRPWFPEYTFENGKSVYRGEEVGEGGYVYAEPGMYSNVALLDIASMHPSSIVAENLFGYEYTQRFKDILDARIAIKHKDFESAKKMLGGKLEKYLTDESSAKDLAQALKIAINSVYGLTSAKFENPFRDIRNVDNIVAKRGALFMVNLKHMVQERGFTVAHIKTDSIKIPDATPEIISFVMEYGKLYGYNFEHEATYDRMCLVNDAVYIARYPDGKWTATGTQFQVPYVFKTLFSKEEIVFTDLCETKSASTALYLDMNEDLPDDEHNYIFVGKVGSFCPMKHGGGLLMRENVDEETGEKTYAYAGGTKGWRWLEAETVRGRGLEDDIDISYYEKLACEARDAISRYGDFEWFTGDDSADFPPDDELPF